MRTHSKGDGLQPTTEYWRNQDMFNLLRKLRLLSGAGWALATSENLKKNTKKF